MNDILHDHIPAGYCVCYCDDLVSFAKRSNLILGFKISVVGWVPKESKMAALVEWSAPETVKVEQSNTYAHFWVWRIFFAPSSRCFQK